MTLHRAAACSHHRAGALPSGAHAAARNSHCRWVTAKTETTLRAHFWRSLHSSPGGWRCVVLLITEHAIGG